MGHRLILLSALMATACGTATQRTPPPTQQPTQQPLRAQLQIFVEPNPIVATQVSGNTYDFPFVIGVRELNGISVEVNRVGIEVTALGALSMYRRSFDRAELERRRYPTSIPAHGEIRYQFNQRESVPDERLFSTVAAELFAEGVDANGNAVRASERVTVTRR
jgi:hypothetical protein